MLHPPITIDGQLLSLAHLQPFRRQVSIELQGRITKSVVVEFHFSCHCYSRSLEQGEVAPAGQAVPDGSRHMPRPRVFNSERYALSKDLAGMLDHLIATNGRVSKSQHDNYHRVEAVAVERAGRMKTVSYFIFMRAMRIHEAGRPSLMSVKIESAYAVSDDRPPPADGPSRSLGRMLGERWSSRGPK